VAQNDWQFPDPYFGAVEFEVSRQPATRQHRVERAPPPAPAPAPTPTPAPAPSPAKGGAGGKGVLSTTTISSMRAGGRGVPGIHSE
jgi:hypothetical protein